MKQSGCLSVLSCYVLELACFSIAKVLLLPGFLPRRIFVSILTCKFPWKYFLLQTVPEYLSIFFQYVLKNWLSLLMSKIQLTEMEQKTVRNLDLIFKAFSHQH